MTIPEEGDILNVRGIRVIIVRHSPRENPCDECVLDSICTAGDKGFICDTGIKPVPVEDLL